MNDVINNLFESLKGTSIGTKLIALMGGVSFLAMIGLVAVVSNRTDFQMTFSNLNDHEVATVSKALADAGIPFSVSSHPAPFNVYVDEETRHDAFAAVYGAGALDQPLGGILANGGIQSVFASSEERKQGVRKREWGEVEAMLMTLDFVTSATVRTSPGVASPMSRNAPPTTASVSLGTTAPLSAEQKDNVARITSNALGVGREHLQVTDHDGKTIFSGAESNEEGFRNQDARELEALFDQRLADRASEALELMLGPDKAHVVVTSEWNYEQTTSETESSTGKGVLLEEMTNSTERPIAGAGPGGGAGGIAGISSNVAISDGTTNGPTATGTTQLETTSESTKKFAPLIKTEKRVSVIPKIKRLSVALFVDDEMVPADGMAEIEDVVRVAVGFDSTRDTFKSARQSFFVPETPEAPATEEEPASPPNPMIENLMRRGVEIVSALVFVFILLKSLKTSTKSASAGESGGANADDGGEIDHELLARANVDELLKSDPDRVGEILSSWARGEDLVESK